MIALPPNPQRLQTLPSPPNTAEAGDPDVPYWEPGKTFCLTSERLNLFEVLLNWMQWRRVGYNASTAIKPFPSFAIDRF